jgi:hypothetical protein
MTNFDELLSNFQPQRSTPQNDPFNFISTPEHHESTPEELDLERLENDIQEIFNARRFANKLLTGLLGVIGSTAGVHLFAKLGIPALATSTLGGVVVAIAFGNALTSVRIENGRPTVDGDFFIALAQALGVTGSLWLGASEYRQLNHVAQKGTSTFLTEVKEFSVTPQSPDFTRIGLVGVGLTLLIVAIAIFKGGTRSGY